MNEKRLTCYKSQGVTSITQYCDILAIFALYFLFNIEAWPVLEKPQQNLLNPKKPRLIANIIR